MRFLVPENATPIEDISGLKQEGISTYAQLCEAEAENILKATRKYLAGKRSLNKNFFSQSTLVKIHREMFKDVWLWAGEYRKTVTNIGVKPYLIQHELANLCHDVRFWENGVVSMCHLEKAARIHHRLVFIHPFENGNGRHARLIADIYLNVHLAEHPKWPVDIMNDGATRKVYITALKEADCGNYAPLIDFMIACEAKVTCK